MVFSSITIYLCGVDYTIRVKELCSWNPDLLVEHTDDEVTNSVGDEGMDPPVNDAKEEDDVMVFSNEGNIGEVKVDDDPFTLGPLITQEFTKLNVNVHQGETLPGVGNTSVGKLGDGGVSHDGATMTGRMSHSLERSPAASMGSVAPTHGHLMSLGCSDAINCQENHNSFSTYSDESPKQRFGFSIIV
ncbi:hypothetical protein L1887_02993 [Cichorium endivia]|nr:hypothetical protein L1887_02993 [Cichorium endivia]